MQFILYDNFPLDDIFNNKLIDCLPGIFYLYEIKGDNYLMKAWNKNHGLITGYSKEESIDKPPLFYVDEESKPAIAAGVKKLLTVGYVKNVYGNLKTKSGDSIPFVFEGYKFSVNNREFFMGLGIDISDLADAKKQLKQLNALKRKKEKELLSETLKKQQKEQLLQAISSKLDLLLQQNNNTNLQASIEKLQEKIHSHYQFENNWDTFELTFNAIHHNFFTDIKKRFPGLTKSELQYCAYSKLNMSNEQIISILHISKEGLRKRRYRLARKFNLEKTKDLEDYIQTF